MLEKDPSSDPEESEEEVEMEAEITDDDDDKASHNEFGKLDDLFKELFEEVEHYVETEMNESLGDKETEVVQPEDVVEDIEMKEQEVTPEVEKARNPEPVAVVREVESTAVELFAKTKLTVKTKKFVKVDAS
ncbi:hypothetical protein QQ045_011058 [Rhodiola kirilowii]